MKKTVKRTTVQTETKEEVTVTTVCEEAGLEVEYVHKRTIHAPDPDQNQEEVDEMVNLRFAEGSWMYCGAGLFLKMDQVEPLKRMLDRVLTGEIDE